MSKYVKIIMGLAIASVFIVVTACDQIEVSDSGDYVLIVEVADDDTSDIGEIEQALEIGGQIRLNVDVARELESAFDNKYVASNDEGEFLVRPAVLNFVGDQGWSFQAVEGAGLGGRRYHYFRKAR